MGKSASFCKGKGSIAHNNREFSTSNIDQSRTHLNVTYKQEPIKVAYDKLFGQELERYNIGKKPSRQIPDYMEHIKNSKNGEKLFYENVVQVGTMYTCPAASDDGKTASKILDEYMRGFEERNPNLYVFNAVLHLDEATPHLHIDWIPVASDYKNGLQVRNSLDKALKQQGIDGKSNKKENRTQVWQKSEREQLIKVMEKYGWEYEAAMETDRGNLSVSQYKAMVEEVNNRINSIPDKGIEKQSVPFSKDKVMVSASDLANLEQRANLMQERERIVGNIQEYHAEKMAEIDEYAIQKQIDIEEYAHQKQQEIDSKLDEIKEIRASAKQEELHFFSAKQNYTREAVEFKNQKAKYEKLYDEQIGLNHAYNKLKSVVAEQDKTISNLEQENTSLRGQIADLKAEISQKIQEAIQPFKGEIEALKTKMKDIALGEATLLKAVKYVAKHFSGEVSEAILRATYQKGDEWLKHDGFEEMSGYDAGLPKSITAKMDMKLTFMDGDEGRGVYSPKGTCVANVKTIKEAREMFPNSKIENRVNTQMLSR